MKPESCFATALSLLFLLAIPAHAQQTTVDATLPVDRTFTANGDMAGDGSVDTLKLHITGASMTSAFKWTLEVTDAKGAVMFHEDHDDAPRERFFHDRGYEPGCASYVACKQLYYFNQLPERIFASTKPAASGLAADDFVFTVLPGVAAGFLKTQNVAQNTIAAAIADMQATLRKPGLHTLIVPVSPVQDAPPMMWVPRVRLFVPYYEP